jgi:hypothetical protein
MTLVVGHLGKPAAGKGTVSAIFAELAQSGGFTVAEIRFSDPLRETLHLLNAMSVRDMPGDPKVINGAGDILREVWDIEPIESEVRAFIRIMAAHFGADKMIAVDRPNLQKLPVLMQPLFGKGVLSHAVFSRAKKRGEDLVQVDGVRWYSDENALKALPNALLCYTKASFEVRSRRMLARMRDGEEKKTLDQLLAEDNATNEQFIYDIGTRAHFEIENEFDSLEILRPRVEKHYEKYVLPRLSKKADALSV